MKKVVYIIALLLPLFSGYCQRNNTFASKNQPADSLTSTFKQYTKPFPVPENTPRGSYKILASFTINKDNSITGIKILEDPGHGLGDTAIKLIASWPKTDPDLVGRLKNNKDSIRVNFPFLVRID